MAYRKTSKYRQQLANMPWKERIGWSRILAGLRKSMPRVAAVVD